MPDKVTSAAGNAAPTGAESASRPKTAGTRPKKPAAATKKTVSEPNKAASTPKKTTSSARKTASTPKKRKGRGRKPRKINLGTWAAIGIAAAVVVGLLLVFFPWRGLKEFEAEAGIPQVGARVPKGEWQYGIDISHHNGGRIVWDSLYVMTDARRRTVKNPFKAKDIKPVSFVFIKATEGISLVDKDFRKNWKNAGRSGLKRGAYHFFRSSKPGAQQARLFIKTVGDLRFKDLPPVLDIEKIHKGGSKARLNKEALAWLRTIEDHYGKKPIVYTGASFAKDYLSKEILDNYPVWIAHYEKEKPSYDGWTWWQFTDKAVVKGVDGHVDLSVTRPKSKK
jgi:lysozyme